MPIIGSDGGFQADNRGGIIDELGNTIVSSDTKFASSPLGVAARTQALYGIPNANFNLTPPDPDSPIVANQNDLPYWSIEELSDGVMTATTVFDSTTQTWGVQLNPGTAASGASLSLSTRSYLLTDDNLALRQKALAVLSKSGTAGGTASQWNLTLSAIYRDSTDTALSTAVIGTALDTGTWTSFSGTTTPGGSAISAAAQYVDLTFTLTTTAAVTGSVTATIKSLILATSTGTGGSQSFLVTQTYTANDTWTRPTGVNYLVAVVAAGGGGGGRGGIARAFNGTAAGETGQGGGSGAGFYIVRDLYVGDQSTVSVGIGAGGAGGSAANVTKAAAGTATQTVGPNNGSAGGATTFGSYFTANGGNPGTARQGAAAPSNATTIVYGGANVLGGVGGTGSNDATAGGNGAIGGFTNFTVIPYSVATSVGATGGSASITGGTVTTSAPGTSTTGWIGGGGGGGNGTASAASSISASGNGSYGGGGAGGQASIWVSAASTNVSGSAGAGGNGVNGGGGGAGGNAVMATSSVSNYNSSILNFNSGKGGDGGSGWLTVVYIA